MGNKNNSMREILFTLLGFIFFLFFGGVIDAALNPNYKTHMNAWEWPLIILAGIVGGFIGWVISSKIDSKEQKTGTKIMAKNVWLYGVLLFLILVAAEYFFGYIAMIIVFIGSIVFLSYKKKIKIK